MGFMERRQIRPFAAISRFPTRNYNGYPLGWIATEYPLD